MARKPQKKKDQTVNEAPFALPVEDKIAARFTQSTTELKNPTESSPKETSIDLVYDISISSYESVLKRLDHLDTKNQHIIQFGVTIFLAIPVLFGAGKTSLASIPFIVSVLLLIASVTLSLISRQVGEVIVLNPKNFSKEWMELDAVEFKKNMILFAGDNFEHNLDLLRKRRNLNLLSFLLLMSSLLLALIWIPTISR